MVRTPIRMRWVFPPDRVEPIVKHTFDRHGREVLQFGISEMPNGTLAHLVGALPRFSACIDALHILQATG
jgi:hypothetical protein